MSWWQYLMLVNVYLVLFYGFYVLLLHKETFFQLNRIYLVAAAILSFFIPIMQADWVRNLFITQTVQTTIYKSPVMYYQFTTIQHTHYTVGQVLVVIYLTGMVFLMGRLAWQLIRLKKVIAQAQPKDAFSFFGKINVSEEHAGNHAIVEHEHVHARQWHSADVLMIEAVMIINWFNPVVYLYRHAIKHIHEFIADRQAIKAGTDKADYAMLLLSQTFNAPPHTLVNPFFNNSLLKQRIMMLQKSRSHRVALVKYCLSAPLFILMLVLSSATVNNSTTVQLINDKAEEVFLTPAITDSLDVISPNTQFINLVKLSPSRSIQLPDTTPKKDGRVFTTVERAPQFKGGITQFGKYLSTNIKYPARARENGVSGRVFIGFIVERNGLLSDVHIVRGVDNDLDNEALRVMKLSPKWTPGVQNGSKVRVQYIVPISFALKEDAPAKGKKIGVVNLKTEDADTSKRINNYFTTLSDTTKKTTFSTSPSLGNPLYILDGKEIANLAFVDPDRIESISVLKDKAATALYGIKGAKGVVVITSKKQSLPPAATKAKQQN